MERGGSRDEFPAPRRRPQRRSGRLASAALALAALTAATRAQEEPPVIESLKGATVPAVVERLTGQPLVPHYVTDEAAAVALGKALFWDMQAGSDGQACASCHFHAGADNRVKNQLNPNVLGGNGAFDARRSGGPVGPNTTVTADDFPFHVLADPADRDSAVLFDTDDVMSSQGVFATTFEAVVPGSPAETCEVLGAGTGGDPLGFQVGGVNVRRAPPRNTPTVVNAIFNHRNFWDGRANTVFNGVDPFGRRNAGARVLEVQPDGSVAPLKVEFEQASLASQAVGPLLSDVEMSCSGRTFPDAGQKLLSLQPLALQEVASDDSVLGGLSLAPAPGLDTTYADMIAAAFDARFWDSDVLFDGDGEALPPAPPGVGGEPSYTLMERNFSLFWGLAIQAYEATLVSDDAPFDRWADGELATLGDEAMLGMDVFSGAGGCIACHDTAAFTSASTMAIQAGEGVIERMRTAGQTYNYMVQGVGVATGASGRWILDVDAQGTPISLGIEGLGLGRLTITYVANPAAPVRQGGLEGTVGQAPIKATYDAVGFVLDADGIPGTRDAGVFGLLAEGPIGAAPSVTLTVTDGMGAPDHVSLSTGGQVLLSAPLVTGNLVIEQPALYDNGFYNIAVRPKTEDLGVGAEGPFGEPLSFSRQAIKGLLGFEVPDPFVLQPCLFEVPWHPVVDLAFFPGGFVGDDCDRRPADVPANQMPIRKMRTAVAGAFKTPTLRNVSLTGPYFHNGGQATLEQVVAFYNRGADFAHVNRNELPPDILPLGLTAEEQAALVAFLETLTDERVANESAPFDHPQLFLPDGHPGDHLFVVDSDGDGAADASFHDDPSVFVELPAVGAGGRADLGMPPLEPFLRP